MKALLIHYKSAGGGAASIAALIKAVRRAGWKARSLPIKKADGKAIEEAKPDLVVVAGGDGTIAKVLRMLPDRSVPVDYIGNPAVRRWLAGEPEATAADGLPWDVRKTGSAAIECAFVAAGLLRVARFERPNVWDGLPLVMTTGGVILTRIRDEWTRSRGSRPLPILTKRWPICGTGGGS